jgi:hypothetical protein
MAEETAEEPTFQTLEADLPDGKLGKVDAAGVLYDVTVEGEPLTLDVVKGDVKLASLANVEGIDGPALRISLTSNLAERLLAAGDELALKGDGTGHVTVTIQRT